MALTIDGYAVLHSIGGHREIFGGITPDINKAAQALVTKLIKAKTTDLGLLRKLRATLGDQDFGFLIDGLKDAEVKAALTKIDKHWTETKTAGTSMRRDHLRALVAGAAEPAPQLEKPAKSRAGAKRPSRLKSDAMAAIRQQK